MDCLYLDCLDSVVWKPERTAHEKNAWKFVEQAERSQTNKTKQNQ